MNFSSHEIYDEFLCFSSHRSYKRSLEEKKKKNTDPYSQSTYSMNSVRSHSPLVNARKGATYASTNTTRVQGRPRRFPSSS